MRVFEGALALQRGELDAALHVADEVIRRHPGSFEARRLRGDALLRQGHLAEAAEVYEAALTRVPGDGAPARDAFDLETRLWACYSRLSRPADAYRVLRHALGDLYRSAVGYRELAALANAALDAGDGAVGCQLAEFALVKTPGSETELRRSLEARIRSLH